MKLLREQENTVDFNLLYYHMIGKRYQLVVTPDEYEQQLTLTLRTRRQPVIYLGTFLNIRPIQVELVESNATKHYLCNFSRVLEIKHTSLQVSLAQRLIQFYSRILRSCSYEESSEKNSTFLLENFQIHSEWRRIAR